MDVRPDGLAGIVDLFGALTRTELERALAELAFKRGEDVDADDDPIGAALASYHLVAVDAAAVSAEADPDAAWLVPGPVAFPALPPDAEDLPHILDLPTRTVDQTAAGRAAEERFRADAAAAVESGDTDRIAQLLDVSYELETWAPVDLAGARRRLDQAHG